jgi:hypothetical protein
MRDERNRPTRSVVSSTVMACVLVMLAAAPSHAWTRRPYEDAEVVARSELIVVGHLQPGTIEFLPHPHAPGEGSSHEHHAILVVTGVLKGGARPGRIPVVVHYGLTPVVVGRVQRDDFMLDLRGGRVDYPQDVVEIIDTGSSAPGARVGKDAREDQLWFLRKRAVRNGREPGTGAYGIVDPEDIRPLALKDYYLAYLSEDQERAVRDHLPDDPAARERARRYLDHLEVRRILALEDAQQRAEALLPFFLRRQGWSLRPEARDGLVACGRVAGDLLLDIFRDPERRKLREDIIQMWGEMEYRGMAVVLIELLREHDGFWEEQRLEPGWWNQDVGSALTERRREVYGEVYKSVIALGRIGDARAIEVIERTRRRWRAVTFENPQVVEACDQALARCDAGLKR